ncbi:MAG: hypothetical protein EOL91_06855 [Actinobacteria bacterium]|nr:hypothetical protein [Actinomycetota bacterium]
MPSVLFVCTGNICRSAFAERLAVRLKEELPEAHPAREWTFTSAGTAGLDGWPMCPEMESELVARGGSADGFVAKQVTGTMARSADLILALESVHRAWVLEEWPALVRRTWLLGQAARVAPTLVNGDAREVPGEGTGEGAREGAEGGVGGGGVVDLLAALREHRDRPLASDGIADPYRLGPAAAATAAAEIEAALRVLLG